ncbi:hypothetical protein ADIWIN_0363 [Winogradskyella psychrotolerans RS-3]|uniref:Uncharacterized protein n=1 Tax=Winogradskyella psychrotolerans RS-3 TaxID=641526 RepID=S7VWW8_9FLAO|nr:hypothetical protein [Winogradskyella psychrotolerans]EPR74611.1 hypothetical protein ADIWIN_0363 [Winogradskyella psychrotolerans RS-3]
MKLTKEDIQFIDTYLENSDVVFADIRMEIVDHVASDIEDRMSASNTTDFYNVFKDYMVQNKAQLLKDNRQFLKSADMKIWKAFLKGLVSPLTPLIFLTSFFGFYFLYLNFNIETFRLIISYVPLIGLSGFLLTYVVYHKAKNLKRFSVVERLAMPFWVFYQIPNIIFNFSYQAKNLATVLWIVGIVSLVLTLMLVLVCVSIKLFKSYEKQYKTLA